MGRTFQIEVEVPHGLQAGDKFVIDIEQPLVPKVKKTRLANIPLDQMTIEQLKRELINARSMLYKAQARGDEKKLVEATKRVNRAASELAKRNGTTLFEEVNAPIGLFDEDVSM